MALLFKVGIVLTITILFKLLFSSPVLPPWLVLPSALAKCQSFVLKVFYVIGKVLTGELSCLVLFCVVFK